MKKLPIINYERFEEVRKKIGDIFIKEKLSPLEVKLIIDVIYNNLENLEDIYTKAQLIENLSKNVTQPPIPGVS